MRIAPAIQLSLLCLVAATACIQKKKGAAAQADDHAASGTPVVTLGLCGTHKQLANSTDHLSDDLKARWKNILADDTLTDYSDFEHLRQFVLQQTKGKRDILAEDEAKKGKANALPPPAGWSYHADDANQNAATTAVEDLGYVDIDPCYMPGQVKHLAQAPSNDVNTFSDSAVAGQLGVRNEAKIVVDAAANAEGTRFEHGHYGTFFGHDVTFANDAITVRPPAYSGGKEAAATAAAEWAVFGYDALIRHELTASPASFNSAELTFIETIFEFGWTEVRLAWGGEIEYGGFLAVKAKVGTVPLEWSADISPLLRVGLVASATASPSVGIPLRFLKLKSELRVFMVDASGTHFTVENTAGHLYKYGTIKLATLNGRGELMLQVNMWWSRWELRYLLFSWPGFSLTQDFGTPPPAGDSDGNGVATF